MVMDQSGNGQAVQHSVIERNADWHMVKVVEQFQAVNDWERTKVIMVDKDLNEIQVLRRIFPNARILCVIFTFSNGCVGRFAMTRNTERIRATC
jgi:hypothetical protein